MIKMKLKVVMILQKNKIKSLQKKLCYQ